MFLTADVGGLIDFVYLKYNTRKVSKSRISSVILNTKSNGRERKDYIITHGMAQQSGKQTGTTAAPDLLELFDLLSASYSYFPLAFA